MEAQARHFYWGGELPRSVSEPVGSRGKQSHVQKGVQRSSWSCGRRTWGQKRPEPSGPLRNTGGPVATCGKVQNSHPNGTHARREGPRGRENRLQGIRTELPVPGVTLRVPGGRTHPGNQHAGASLREAARRLPVWLQPRPAVPGPGPHVVDRLSLHVSELNLLIP